MCNAVSGSPHQVHTYDKPAGKVMYEKFINDNSDMKGQVAGRTYSIKVDTQSISSNVYLLNENGHYKPLIVSHLLPREFVPAIVVLNESPYLVLSDSQQLLETIGVNHVSAWRDKSTLQARIRSGSDID
jgi:hypothetical protein